MGPGAPLRTAQNKLPESPGGLSSRPLQEHGSARRHAPKAWGSPHFRLVISEKGGETTLSRGGFPAPLSFWGLPGKPRPGAKEDRSISACFLLAAATLDRTPIGNTGAKVRACLSVRVCECASVLARVPGAHRAVGACACRKRRSPAAWNLDSFPLSRSCGSDTPSRPTGGDDVCSLVASQSPAAAAVH